MSKIVDDNGFWLIKSNPLTKEGVFPYLGKSISAELVPTQTYYVYRPFAEISSAETLESFDGIPFIDDHEMVGEDFTPCDQRPAGGVLMNPVKDDESRTVKGDIKIFSEKMKEKIHSGKKELSLGYSCVYSPEKGIFNGQSYDFVQKEIRGNHLALVEKGRMGSDVRVYDHREFTMDSLEIETITKENGTMEEEKKSETEVKQTEVKDEKVDKRKLIDEIGGILNGKVDEELIRTILGKVEKVAYNGSEETKADDETEKEVKSEETPEKKDGEKEAEKDESPGKKAEEETKETEKEVKETPEEKTEDACGKDEFYDLPKANAVIERFVSQKIVSEEAAKKLQEALKATKYTRAAQKETKPQGLDADDISKISDALFERMKKEVTYTMDKAETKKESSWLNDHYLATK